MSLFAALTAFLIAASLFVFLLRIARQIRSDDMERATRTLNALGLTLGGDVLKKYTLEGELDGVAVTFTGQGSRAAPGARPDEAQVDVFAAELSLPLPNCFICRATDTERMMGPLIPTPRTVTGHAQFDKTYEVYLASEETRSASEPGYRDRPGSAMSWAQPEILDRLLDLKLLWVRVREQRCEITFPPLSPEDAVRAVATCRNINNALHGRSLTDVSSGPRGSVSEVTELVDNISYIPFIAAFWAIFLGFILGNLLEIPAVHVGLLIGSSIMILLSAIWALKLRSQLAR